MRVLLLAMLVAGCTPKPTRLQAAVDRIAAETRQRSPGTELSLAVHDLKTGERAAIAGDVKHVSASTAKVIWVAAALDGAGVDAVAPFAEKVFVESDNEATGKVVDLVGPDAVMAFYVKLGLRESAFTRWNHGATREASNSPRAMGTDNYFTANDAAAFFAKLGELRGGEALEKWLLLTPRRGLGGWLAAKLPASAVVMHKAGWLEPGCCQNRYHTTNDAGLVEIAPGHRYAIAILARGGDDWEGKQGALVERVSCVVYEALSGTDLACD